MTQHEAERCAQAEFLKHSPNSTIKSYIFEKLIYIPSKQPSLIVNGYFLCGRIEWVFAGKTYGPLRIMVSFTNSKTLGLILYDNPETGAHVASSLCTQVEEIDSNP